MVICGFGFTTLSSPYPIFSRLNPQIISQNIRKRNPLFLRSIEYHCFMEKSINSHFLLLYRHKSHTHIYIYIYIYTHMSLNLKSRFPIIFPRNSHEIIILRRVSEIPIGFHRFCRDQVVWTSSNNTSVRCWVCPWATAPCAWAAPCDLAPVSWILAMAIHGIFTREKCG